MEKKEKNMGGYCSVKRLIRQSAGLLLSDRAFISLDYIRVFGKLPDFENPVTYNEKLQWLKLYDRNPLYRKLADKLTVREYIEERFGSEYLFPLLGVYDRYEEIDFDRLPDRFVLKPNHTSGDIFFCESKAGINHAVLEKTIKSWLGNDYYLVHREWQYKGIERKILCEEYMVDDETGIPRNYKFFCFDGSPQIFLLTTGNGTGRPQNYFDMDFNPIPVNEHLRNIKQFEKPEKYEEMLEMVRELAKPFIHVRMDMYVINKKIYIGEFTFHHNSGIKKWKPEEFDLELGYKLLLPERRS